jgi:hypothetical protein
MTSGLAHFEKVPPVLVPLSVSEGPELLFGQSSRSFAAHPVSIFEERAPAHFRVERPF